MATSAWREHHALRRDHPKTGTCVECGREGATDWAFQHHGLKSHSAEIQDYRETCRRCHARLDALVRRLETRFGRIPR